MKKIMKIFIAITFLIVSGLFFMYFFQMCPPKGPWTLPPWCEGDAYIPYEYKPLDYIQEKFEPTNKELDFIIGTFDTWGNPHIWINLGEKPRDHVDTTMIKIKDIGGEGVYFSDFTTFSKDLKVKEAITGESVVSKEDLNYVVSEAKKNGLNKFFLVINLGDPEGPWRRYKNMSMEGTIHEKLVKNLSIENWKGIFESWKKFIRLESKKAEVAGVTHLIVNPWDYRTMGYNATIRDNYYINYIKEAKKHFSGKAGIIAYPSTIISLSQTVINDADFIILAWDPNGDYLGKQIFKDIDGNDLKSIKDSFMKWLSLPYFDKLKDKEVYLHLTIPSYDKAVNYGWIEPGKVYGDDYKVDYKEQAMVYEALLRVLYENRDDTLNVKGLISYGYWWTDRIYPEVKILRNDLSHSIRNKDAENVFYKWSKIFR